MHASLRRRRFATSSSFLVTTISDNSQSWAAEIAETASIARVCYLSTHGRLVLIREALVDKLVHERRLSASRVAEDDDLAAVSAYLTCAVSTAVHTLSRTFLRAAITVSLAV